MVIESFRKKELNLGVVERFISIRSNAHGVASHRRAWLVRHFCTRFLLSPSLLLYDRFLGAISQCVAASWWISISHTVVLLFNSHGALSTLKKQFSPPKVLFTVDSSSVGGRDPKRGTRTSGGLSVPSRSSPLHSPKESNLLPSCGRCCRFKLSKSSVADDVMLNRRCGDIFNSYASMVARGMGPN